MLDISKQEIKLFYCYAREDKTWRDELQKHMRSLKRLYPLREWYDREILPGEEWEKAIDTNLNSAHLVLLLVSPDFMNSDYCYGKEMQRALERHEEGTCRVIPIMLRPTHLEGAPFSKIQMLPTDAKPITRWIDRDEAFQDVVKEISVVLKDLLITLKTKKDWFDEGISFRNLKRYNEALEAFEQALRLDPKYLEAYQQKGITLHELERYDGALKAFEQALRLSPNLVPLYIAKGQTLDALERYEEALTVFEQAIHLDPNLADAYIGRDKVLQQLGISKEAHEQLESQLQEAQQQIADQQKRTEALESQLERACQQRDEAFGQLEVARKEQKQLANQLEQAQQQLVDQQEQSMQLESQLQHTRQQLTDQQKRVEQLESQLEQTQRQKDEALQQLAIAKKEQKQIANQLQQTQQQLTDQQKRVKQLESQLEQMERQKNVALQQLAIAKGAQEELTSQLEKTQQQLSTQQTTSATGARGGTTVRQDSRQHVGDNIEQPVEVTFQEAYAGGARTFNIQSTEACPVCRGTSGRPCTNCDGQGSVTHSKRIQLKIPPGVDNGSKIRVAGEGQPGVGGGPRGDLFLVITVRPDPLYERKGDDLYTDVDVDLVTAMLGGEATVPIPDGRKLILTIPPETQNGRLFRLVGKGMPPLRGKGSGNLYARIKVVLPVSLTDEERALFEKLARSRIH